MDFITNAAARIPWNKGKLVGQKTPLKQREIWAIRIRLQLQKNARELALLNLAIDSKLRSCDLMRLYVRDVSQGGSDVPKGHRYAAEVAFSPRHPDAPRANGPQFPFDDRKEFRIDHTCVYGPHAVCEVLMHAAAVASQPMTA